MTRFRDDIDPAKTWVWSDPHFGHTNIIGFCHRPDDFEQLLLENLAEAVPDDEDITLLCLGDVAYGSNARFRSVTSKYLAPLNGRKLLIRGNHDTQRYKWFKQSGFRLARPFSIRWGDWEVSFSHYPWNSDEEGRPMPERHLRIHGHIHNNGYTRVGFVPFLKNHVNISVEQTKYRPVNLASLLSAVIDGQYVADDGAPTSIDADAIRKESHHA